MVVIFISRNDCVREKLCLHSLRHNVWGAFCATNLHTVFFQWEVFHLNCVLLISFQEM